MDSLLNIPFELQLMLVSGYFAYKIAVIGKVKNHRTEDIILQILSFGLLSRTISALILWTLPLNAIDQEISLLFFSVTISIIAGVTIGSAWRAWAERKFKEKMNLKDIYSDDHESSVWQSIMWKKYKWNVVQIYLDNGNVVEANFGKMSPKPKKPLIMNEDGIGMYATGSYDKNNNYEEFGIMGNDGDLIFTYIPRSSIKRVNFTWRVPPADLD